MKEQLVDLEKLKELRKLNRYSHAQISTLLGFKSAQGYFYKETGKTQITANEIKQLADIFEVPVSILYKGSTQKTA